VNWGQYAAWAVVAAQLLVQVILIVRVLLRPHRQPSSRLAWVVVIVTIPIAGIVTYLLFGEVSIGRRRAARLTDVLRELPKSLHAVPGQEAHLHPQPPERFRPQFDLGQSISGFRPVGGNSARLLADSNATIDALVADIDAASEHVHLLFYIWLPDDNGCRVVEALKRAAARGVTCRAMADDLGSRMMIRSPHWKDMRDAGVQLARALQIGNPLLRSLVGRVDLRNHRKIVVVDSSITYCGSQNCADPEFRIKAKYAPWVDIMIRFEGPVAAQNQLVFASDWMACTGEDLGEMLSRAVMVPDHGIPAQVIATGPTMRYSAMPEMFESLMGSARSELMITTPYYVPDESMQTALCSAGYRGVDTTIVFPARNDSRVVAAASRSYYGELLKAGVKIHEFQGGLLHAKTMTVDGELALVGSANLDRRSFDLNYENNILVCDPALATEVRQRQSAYLARANPVTLEDVDRWPLRRRLWNNTIAMIGPLL